MCVRLNRDLNQRMKYEKRFFEIADYNCSNSMIRCVLWLKETGLSDHKGCVVDGEDELV